MDINPKNLLNLRDHCLSLLEIISDPQTQENFHYYDLQEISEILNEVEDLLVDIHNQIPEKDTIKGATSWQDGRNLALRGLEEMHIGLVTMKNYSDKPYTRATVALTTLSKTLKGLKPPSRG